jgi:glycosyltransferase involved in cell wall biosynthesis
MPKFSVLMSVYYKEKASNLNQCLESLANQTLPANEVVIVKDGALNDDLNQALELWIDKLPLKIVGYNENKGLAYALNYGLQYCSYELVARMDSDDICLHDRFEKQIGFMENNQDIALLSGYISEFNDIPNDILSIRKVPIGYKEIVKSLKKRNAFNHMTIMFKKSAIFSVNGYQKLDGFEDHDLWIRLVQAGLKVNNIPEILVYVRIGNNMIDRRAGFNYLKKEIIFFNKQRKSSFISSIEFIIFLTLRVPVRLLPPRFLAVIYRHFLRG